MKKDRHQIVLHLGSNLGNRRHWLREALLRLEQQVGTILRRSSLYQTEAWGVTDQPDFYNMAVVIETRLSAHDILQEVAAIEDQLERQREQRWGPRSLDIDLIFYDNQIIQTEDLQIPHPRMQDRNFVLIPLLEIIPDWPHPQLGVTVEELYWSSEDPLEVIQLEQQL